LAADRAIQFSGKGHFLSEPDPLTHFSAAGRARMVDVSDKVESQRVAIASGILRMQPATLERIRAGTLAKGNVLAVADVAAVMGAKRTAELIPMCHPLALTGVEVEFSEILTADTEGCVGIKTRVTTRTSGQTGVEMEALCAASAALLTIYDMCKAIDRGMRIENIQLEEKRGGKSGVWRRGETHAFLPLPPGEGRGEGEGGETP
jgi:cyclic pyranopterin phosphate synthase